MSMKFNWTRWAWALLMLVSMLLFCLFMRERERHLKTRTECEKREALIKQADEYASAIEASLEAEREKRANLEYEYERLEAKYNNVRKHKKANAFSNLPHAVRADSLRGSILRAVEQ